MCQLYKDQNCHFALKDFLVNKYKGLKTKGKGYDMIHKLATFQTKTREFRYCMYFLTNIYMLYIACSLVNLQKCLCYVWFILTMQSKISKQPTDI